MIELLLFEDMSILRLAARRKENDFGVAEVEVKKSVFPFDSVKGAVDHLADIAVADEKDITVFMFCLNRIEEPFAANDELREILRAFAFGHIGDGLRLDYVRREELLYIGDLLSGHGAEVSLDEIGEFYRLRKLEVVGYDFGCDVCTRKRGGVDGVKSESEVLDMNGEILRLADSDLCKRKVAVAVEDAVYVVFVLTVADEVDAEHGEFIIPYGRLLR